jgi:hypothetical protein
MANFLKKTKNLPKSSKSLDDFHNFLKWTGMIFLEIF